MIWCLYNSSSSQMRSNDILASWSQLALWLGNLLDVAGILLLASIGAFVLREPVTNCRMTKWLTITCHDLTCHHCRFLRHYLSVLVKMSSTSLRVRARASDWVNFNLTRCPPNMALTTFYPTFSILLLSTFSIVCSRLSPITFLSSSTNILKFY